MIDKLNWCIKATEENTEIVRKYLNSLHSADGIWPFLRLGYYYGVKDGISLAESGHNARPQPYQTEITFEEFNTYILQDKPLKVIFHIFN